MVDDSQWNIVSTKARIILAFTDDNKVVRSARVKFTYADFRPPVVKLVPAFYISVSKIENSAC